MNRNLRLVLMIFLGLALTACSGKKDQGTVNTNSSVAPTSDNADAYGTGYSMQDLLDMGIDGNPLDYKTVYFQYNSSNVDRKSDVIVRAHARKLASMGGASVSLEGHADERGTRDYNLALGERRSQAVAQIMNAEGAGNSDLRTISYGEERAANPAHNEAAWQQNRRVEISY